MNKHYIIIVIKFKNSIIKITPLSTIFLLYHFFFMTCGCSHIHHRLRSVSRLKSGFTLQIGIHWHSQSWFDLMVFSKWRPFQILRSMAELLVRARADVTDVIGRWFENVRNGHRFENWMPNWDFETKDIDLRYICRLEAGCWSESYIHVLWPTNILIVTSPLYLSRNNSSDLTILFRKRSIRVF